MRSTHVCLICNKIFTLKSSLMSHIAKLHNLSSKDYYDRYFIKPGDGICSNEICKKETIFFHGKYRKYCSRKCSNSDVKIREKIKQTFMEKYNFECAFQVEEFKKKARQTMMDEHGVEYALQNKEFNKKAKQTFMEKYGVDNPKKNKKIQEKTKQTNLETYGVEYPAQNVEIQEKIKQTNLERYGNVCSLHCPENEEKTKRTMIERYGVEYPAQNEEIREKFKQTNLEKYGVEYPAQNEEIFRKILKNSYTKKEYILFSGKIINLLGHEPQFLDYVFENNLLKEDEIIYNPEKIEYFDENNKQHYYFPDFYIPKWNLIIEIKNSYLYKKDYEEITLKEHYTKQNGFNYIIIIDNEFTEFSKLIKEINEK